jgi:hypothetical protein
LLAQARYDVYIYYNVNLFRGVTVTKANDSERISRRVMLAGTTLALGVGAAGAAVRRAAAQTKISQAAAKYQTTPKGPQSCAVCVNFQPPTSCRFVDGTISPNGWCTLFAAKT